MRRIDDSTQPIDETVENSRRAQSVLIGLQPDDPTLVVLNGRRVVLGRSHECDVVIEAPSVSRRHAEIYWEGSLLKVRDLGSANGTYVDSRRVKDAPFGAGMVLRMGGWLGGVEDVAAQHLSEVGFQEILPGVAGGAVLGRTLRPVFVAAPSNLPVLLIGATGVGKERVATGIHLKSGRAGPLHAVNCASIPVSLAEAEFFGYAKGAFTGADQAHPGHVLAADGGTLFLDELGDLPLATQPLLLRVLDQGEVVPIGRTQGKRFDARVVSATQEPLTGRVDTGRFRSDLAARLSGLVVELPPLAERRLDIPRLFHRLLCQHAGHSVPGVSPALYERLCEHSWPGNVRELELLARQLLALHGQEPVLHRSHLPSGLASRALQPSRNRSSQSKGGNALDTPRAELIRALEQAGGNVRQAAASLGMTRQRAYRLLDSHTLQRVRDSKR